MSPPRLTGALRSFSNVSRREDFTEQLYDLKVSQVLFGDLFKSSLETNIVTATRYISSVGICNKTLSNVPASLCFSLVQFHLLTPLECGADRVSLMKTQ